MRRIAVLLCLGLLAGCGHTLPLARPAAGDLKGTSLGEATLDLLSYNTWGKPGILGTREAERFAELGPALRGPELVALQETFTSHTRSMMGAAGFPFTLWMNNGSALRLNCGLSTLSRFPITLSDFAAFEHAATWDRFARKGVLFTRLEIPGIGPVDLYNTHYQAEAPYGEIRKHDNAVLEALTRKHDAGYPTLIAGDFNMTADSPEYAHLVARLNPRDSFAEANPSAPGYTCDPKRNPNVPAEEPQQRIDYIFILPNPRYAIDIQEVSLSMDHPVKGMLLSDHFGVRARLRLRKI